MSYGISLHNQASELCRLYTWQETAYSEQNLTLTREQVFEVRSWNSFQAHPVFRDGYAGQAATVVLASKQGSNIVLDCKANDHKSGKYSFSDAESALEKIGFISPVQEFDSF